MKKGKIQVHGGGILEKAVLTICSPYIMHHQLGEPTNMIKKHVKKTEVFECRLKTLEFCCQRVTKTEGKGKKCCEYSRTDHFDAQHKIHKFFCACFLLSFAFFLPCNHPLPQLLPFGCQTSVSASIDPLVSISMTILTSCTLL